MKQLISAIEILRLIDKRMCSKLRKTARRMFSCGYNDMVLRDTKEDAAKPYIVYQVGMTCGVAQKAEQSGVLNVSMIASQEA
jgi:hypothetical protein